MTINATVARRTDGGWDFTWSGGTPPYAIWLDGELQETTTLPAWSSTLANYEDVPPDVEILSAGDDSQNEELPPYQLLQWRGNQNADVYLVSQFIDSAWVVVQTINEVGLGYYQWPSPPQPDGVLVQYRIQASDNQGNTGSPLSFSVEVCRNPIHPSTTATIVAGNLVIGAA